MEVRIGTITDENGAVRVEVGGNSIVIPSDHPSIANIIDHCRAGTFPAILPMLIANASAVIPSVDEYSASLVTHESETVEVEEVVEPSFFNRLFNWIRGVK